MLPVARADAQRLVDLGAADQRSGQLSDEALGLRELLSVRDADRCRSGQRLPELDGLSVEAVPVMGVHVQRPYRAVREEQWKRQRAMDAEPADARAEAGPLRKVFASQELLRAAGTVAKKLAAGCLKHTATPV